MKKRDMLCKRTCQEMLILLFFCGFARSLVLAQGVDTTDGFKNEPYGWIIENIGGGSDEMCGVAIGQGRNDGVLRVYGGCYNKHVYEFTYSDTGWRKIDLGITANSDYVRSVIVGSGRYDCVIRVYAIADNYLNEFTYSGAQWNRSSFEWYSQASGDIGWGVGLGAGRNDEQPRVYCAGGYDNKHGFLKEFTYDAGGFQGNTIVSTSKEIVGIAVGNGRNDGYERVYGVCFNGNVYECSYIDSGWVKEVINVVPSPLKAIAIGTGRNDNIARLYIASGDYHIYELSYQEENWIKIDLGYGGQAMCGVAVASGRNDGVDRVYGANLDGHIYEFTYSDTSWTKVDLGTPGTDFLRIAVGKGRGDDQNRVYGAAENGSIYEFSYVAPTPNISLKPLFHVFEDVNVGSSSTPLEVSISNTGMGDLDVFVMTFSETADFTLDVNGGSNPCGSTTPTIKPDSTRTVAITFRPISGGPKVAHFIIASNDPDTASVILAANGVLVVEIPDTSAEPGETFHIPIRIFDATGIAAVEIAVEYDSSILTALGAQTTALTSGFGLVDSVSNGKIAISLASATGISGGGGSLVDVDFQVNSTAIPGDTCSLILQAVSLYDENTEVIETSAENGLFTVSGLSRIVVFPISDTVDVGETIALTAEGFDAYENPIVISPSWRVMGGIGTIEPTTGSSTEFTATDVGIGGVIAMQESLADTASLVVGISGDINGDSEPDVRDAVICLRIIAELPLPPIPPGHETPTAYEQWAADMSGDGQINVDDALLILYESLKRLLPKRRLLTANTGEAVVRIPKIATLPGQLITVPVVVEKRTDICAASVFLKYDPKSMTVLDIEPGVSNSLIAANTKRQGQIKMALINANGLVNSEGEMVIMKFEVKEERKGESYLYLQKISLYDGQPKSIPARILKARGEQAALPREFALLQNYPNPFNTKTTIIFQLPRETTVSLWVYNLNGQTIKTLMDTRIQAGQWTVTWDGKDNLDQDVSSGVYFYSLVINQGKWSSTRKMILLR